MLDHGFQQPFLVLDVVTAVAEKQRVTLFVERGLDRHGQLGEVGVADVRGDQRDGHGPLGAEVRRAPVVDVAHLAHGHPDTFLGALRYAMTVLEDERNRRPGDAACRRDLLEGYLGHPALLTSI